MFHTAAQGPDGDLVTAAEVAGATNDLAGALVFSAGCHAGLNDPGLLDLPQAYAQKRAHFVGNTGYGFGGAGIGYSEELALRFARELLRDTSSRIGVALMRAKQMYYAQSLSFNANAAKALMELTLYGLPMYQVSSRATFNGDAEFHPSPAVTFALRAYWARIRQIVFNAEG
jgi:hypothetical protein